MTILDVVFDADAINVDEIVPAPTVEPQVALEILAARRTVGELLFAREEDFAVADLCEIEADQQDAKADKTPDDLARRKLQAEAVRNRVLAARSRFRARHRELEILTHLQRKNGN